MLLNFVINSNATAYLRSMAEEFGESTNSICVVIGDYAKGKDSGLIELLLVGEINKYTLARKVEGTIDLRIEFIVASEQSYARQNKGYASRLLIWGRHIHTRGTNCLSAAKKS